MQMPSGYHPHVKICCISSIAEAELAVSTGASALGLVGDMPSGPGVISDASIREIAEHMSGDVDTFLLPLFHHKRVKTSTIQIVDAIPINAYEQIRDALPDVKLAQVVHVSGEASLPYAMLVSNYADVLLLDSGNPNLDIKVLGGTGKTHDWSISKRIVDEADIPVFLAGGLNSSNVQEAISVVQPFGLDLCSGVRSDGALDSSKLSEFFTAVKGAALD